MPLCNSVLCRKALFVTFLAAVWQHKQIVQLWFVAIFFLMTFWLRRVESICETYQAYRNMSCFAGEYSVAYVTVPDDTVAKTLARGLVQNKLAACVNIIPQLTSIYEWEGKIQEDPELLLMIKTRTNIVDALTKYVKENHPYTICEVISLPIQNGNDDYLNWISKVIPPLDKSAQENQDT